MASGGGFRPLRLARAPDLPFLLSGTGSRFRADPARNVDRFRILGASRPKRGSGAAEVLVMCLITYPMPRSLTTLLSCLTLAVLAGCATSSPADRPEVETNFRQGSADWSGLIDADYYIPQIADTDLSSLPDKPGARYVRVDEPGYSGVTVEGGMQAVREARSRVMSGFTCPVRGQVFVGALIDASGQSHSPRVTGGIHPDCDAKALELFNSLSYVPAQVGGQPVAMGLGLPVRFD